MQDAFRAPFSAKPSGKPAQRLDLTAKRELFFRRSSSSKILARRKNSLTASLNPGAKQALRPALKFQLCNILFVVFLISEAAFHAYYITLNNFQQALVV
jgi:hypothetical protein